MVLGAKQRGSCELKLRRLLSNVLIADESASMIEATRAICLQINAKLLKSKLSPPGDATGRRPVGLSAPSSGLGSPPKLMHGPASCQKLALQMRSLSVLPITNTAAIRWLQLASEARSTQAKPVFSGHGLEWRGGIGPGRQVVELAVRMACDDAGVVVGEARVGSTPLSSAVLRARRRSPRARHRRLNRRAHSSD